MRIVIQTNDDDSFAIEVYLSSGVLFGGVTAADEIDLFRELAEILGVTFTERRVIPGPIDTSKVNYD